MGHLNSLLMIGLIWLASVGMGTWMTFFQQPSEIEDLRTTEQYARIRQSELSALLSEESVLQGQSAMIQAQWDSRYKTIPKNLRTHEVVAYLNDLTPTGFESFNVVYEENVDGSDFNTHLFGVTGRGTFSALYDFVWAIENYRSFYRISDFELNHIDMPSVDRNTGREKLDVLVSFNFKVHGFYGGKAGLSADDALPGALTGGMPTPMTALPPVPASVLPTRTPAKNPFYPIIMSTIPPNTRGLLDLDAATLISIVDGRAIFATTVKGADASQPRDRLTDVTVGDDVYLGRIVMVDPINNKVVARLNIGGIMDERSFQLGTDPNFRQAIGSAQLAPSN
ncbi:MAG: hypothetical protein ACI80V_002327 [Rhodothermales bacterium]|jgi:hypothetical protein